MGLFGGAGATLLWEAVLKPMRERRSLAEVLVAEISLNLDLLAAVRVLAKPDQIPPDFESSTIVFDSCVARVGELPPRVVGEVVFLYRYFHQLNELPQEYVRLVDNLRNVPGPEKDQRTMVKREIQASIEVFYTYVEKSLNRINMVQPLLLKVAFPWWSWRSWSARAPRTLTLEESAAKAQAGFAYRAKIAERLRRSSESQTSDE